MKRMVEKFTRHEVEEFGLSGHATITASGKI